MSELSGWGRFPVVEGTERVSEDFERSTAGAALSRGLGRSYGDASLPVAPTDVVANSRRANRLLSRPKTARCECRSEHLARAPGDRPRR